MLPLFFSGLLSYLVGMKMRTSKCITCKRDNYLSSLCTNLSWRPRFTFFVNLFQLYVTFILQWIAFIFGRDEEDQACGTNLTFSVMYLHPLTSELYLLTNRFFFLFFFFKVMCYLYSSMDCFHKW